MFIPQMMRHGKRLSCHQWYDRFVFPYIEILVTSGLSRIRRRLLKNARGRVVEIGAGAAQNLPHLPEAVHSYIAADPSPIMAGKAKKEILRPAHSNTDALAIRAAAEYMPVKSNSADTVISFLVLCSVQDQLAALSEIHRLMRPDGIFLFFEHVLAPQASTAKWQNRINPLWKRLAGGCHLNRNTADSIEKSGFVLQEFRRYRSSRMGPPLTSNVIEGMAVIRSKEGRP